jgi:hypothetical protein
MAGAMMSMIANNVLQHVTANLALYYDPSNPNSYSGSGTTLNDLSGNNLNATIVGNPLFSDGYFTLTGTQTINSSNLQSIWYNGSGEDLTIEVWANPNGEGSLSLESNNLLSETPPAWTNSLQACVTDTNFEYRAGYWINEPLFTTSSINPVIGSWNQFVFAYTSTGLGNLLAYLNTSPGAPLVGQKEYPWDDGKGPNYFLCFGRDVEPAEGQIGTGQGWAGKIGLIRVYNSCLTQAQISQNYNATKALYGL